MPSPDQTIDAFRDRATPHPAGVRVAVVQDADATGETAELYAQLREAFFGFVPDVFKLVSARPDMLRVLVDGYTSIAGGELPREAKEVIALTVARTASCQYCTSAHDTLLRLLGTDSQFADAVASGTLDHPSRYQPHAVPAPPGAGRGRGRHRRDLSR
jgi:AhpD family alkylhydroperoxidase